MGVYAASLTAPTLAGDHSYSSFGFEPKFVMLTCTYETTANNDETPSHFCQSFIISGTQVCLSQSSEHGLSSNQNVKGVYKNTALYLVNYNGTILMEASLVSLDSDGITLNFSTTSANIQIGCFALGGSDITNLAIKNIAPLGSASSQAYTGVGFQGDWALCMGTGSTAASGTTDTKSYMSLGFCDSSLNQNVSCGYSNSGSVSNSGVWFNDAFYGVSEGAATQQKAALTAFGADGFTLNWTTSSSSNGNIWVVVGQGGDCQVGTIVDRTSAGTTSDATFSFEPNGLLFAQNLGLGAGSHQTGNQPMVGMVGETLADQCVYTCKQWGLKSSVATRGFNDAKCIRDGVVGTLTAEASVSSFNSDGFTLNYSTAPASAKTHQYMGFYVAGSSPPEVTRTRCLLGVGV